MYIRSLGIRNDGCKRIDRQYTGIRRCFQRDPPKDIENRIGFEHPRVQQSLWHLTKHHLQDIIGGQRSESQNNQTDHQGYNEDRGAFILTYQSGYTGKVCFEQDRGK